MLLDFSELVAKYDLDGNVRGVLHGGAHLAEEADDYDSFLPGVPVWWIEANPAVRPQIMEVLQHYPLQVLLSGLLSDVDDERRMFHVTNYNGMSSSVLDFGTHAESYPDTVFVHDLALYTVTLDTLVAQWRILANMLVMDIQGAEGLALAGAKKLLPCLDYVMLEVNRAEIYVGCAKIWDLDDLLLPYGLTRVETHWVEGQDWGDGFWCKET